MKKVKKSFALMLAMIMLLSSNAYAAEYQPTYDGAEIRVQAYGDDGVMPLYTYIDIITAGLEIDETGCCTFSGSVIARGYDVRLELYLQRSRNQIIWDEIMGAITTVDQAGSMEYQKNLEPEGYYYRAKVVVSVLDSNRNTIETQTVYSESKYY